VRVSRDHSPSSVLRYDWIVVVYGGVLGPYAIWAPVSASRPAYLTQPLYLLVRPTIAHRARFSLFAFSVPVVVYGLYFLTLQLGPELGWSVHLVAGAVVPGGVTALLVSFLIMPSLTGPSRS
jgi:hypothetical protein